jgi:hypothetical protein
LKLFRVARAPRVSGAYDAPDATRDAQGFVLGHVVGAIAVGAISGSFLDLLSSQKYRQHLDV